VCVDFGARTDRQYARAAHRYGAVFDHASAASSVMT